MKEHKNIDQLLNDLDQVLEINDQSSQIDLKELSKKYHEKISNERKAVSKRFIFILSVGILLILVTPTLFAKINIAVIELLLLVSFGLNYKAQKETNSQDLATSYVEFKTQKKEIALANLKLFKRFRVIFYTIFAWSILSYSYDYFSEPDNIKLITYLITVPLGFYITSRAIEDLVKEHQERVKAQD